MDHYKAHILDLPCYIDHIKFAGLADYNTPCSCLSDMLSVLRQVKWVIDQIFYWFTNFFLKENVKAA